MALTFPKPSRIASLHNLGQVWAASRDASGRGGAPGIDWQYPTSFRNNLERNLTLVRHELLSGYQFTSLRPHLIDKGDNKKRIVCIPTVKDRLVQRLILSYLTSERDVLDVINPLSYGFIKGRNKGVRHAVVDAVAYRNKFPWMLKTDITSFFDRIDRTYLKDKLVPRLQKSSIVPLLEGVIDCEIAASTQKLRASIRQNGIIAGRGVRQGMPLSPVLSNFVLRPFDKKINKARIRMVRYADDLAIFADSK